MKSQLSLFLILQFCLGLLLSAQEIQTADGGGSVHFEHENSCVNPELRRQIQEHVAEHKIPASLRSSAVINFDWPFVAAPGSDYYNIDAISNYVDQNFGSGILDWNCGNRSYDGHFGIDIYPWPFWWYSMDKDLAYIVAGAPGTITYKSDGYYDRECSATGFIWNSVYVQHADGSLALYGHLKSGSLTEKAVGETVEAGEFLGVVGSSGFSTGPHLHLEIYNGAGSLIDPYSGTCNSLNFSSWWTDQEDYRNSQVNRLMTHSAPPVFPFCPNTEIPNEKKVFLPGDPIYYAGYYRDQEFGHGSVYRVYKPDGSLHDSWSHVSPSTYGSSYWYWIRSVPVSAPTGIWRFEIEYQGETYTSEFKVCNSLSTCDCEEPVNLQEINLSSTEVELLWNEVIAADGYQIQGGPVGGSTATIVSSDNRFEISVLTPGENYEWQVRAKCGSNISPWSIPSIFSTPVLRPSALNSEQELVVENQTAFLKSRDSAHWVVYDLAGEMLSKSEGSSMSIANLQNGIFILKWRTDFESGQQKILVGNP